MHKKAQVLSDLCRSVGDPEGPRRAIGRAQCNDSYWHGVFGGLYLRHLRDAVWQNLAEAERILRVGQGLVAERLDLDGDGADEIWIHSSELSAVVRPARGGTVSELTDLARGVNLASTLTRRRESYHRTATEVAEHRDGGHDEGAMPSIHELEGGLRVERLPPVDLDARALLVDRILSEGLERSSYERAEYAPLHSWSNAVFDAEVDVGERAVVRLRARGPLALEKTLELTHGGWLEVTYRWDPAAVPAAGWLAPELSMAHDPGVRFDPEPADVWRYDIVTVSKREDGLEETVQGQSITPLWPSELGTAAVLLPAKVEAPG